MRHPAPLASALLLAGTLASAQATPLRGPVRGLRPHPSRVLRVEQGGYGAGALAYSFGAMDLFLESCTFARNRGKKFVGLMTLGSGARLVLENTIVWGNTATAPEVVGRWPEQLDGTFDAAYSCIAHVFEPKAEGEDPIDPENLPGCIALDPDFVSLASGDLHLAAGSPCIDAGNNALVQPDVLTDHDGLPRFVDDPSAPDVGSGTPPLVDMGAHERP